MNKVLIKVFIISCFLAILVNCIRPPECELPKEVGPCRAAIPSFYFNSSSNKCESFMYGGCKENANRFETEEKCIQRCGNTNSRKG